jgi:hypothetical protein
MFVKVFGLHLRLDKKAKIKPNEVCGALNAAELDGESY